jgi:hypothetical protein
MKHFTITSDTEAAALRPFASEPLKVGHIITPSVGSVTHTAWEDYPEADALTFEQCLAIVRDEVTEDVMWEVGGGEAFRTDYTYGFDIEKGRDVSIVRTNGGNVFVTVFISNDIDHAIVPIPNPTATKVRLLAAILRGENI